MGVQGGGEGEGQGVVVSKEACEVVSLRRGGKNVCTIHVRRMGDVVS